MLHGSWHSRQHSQSPAGSQSQPEIVPFLSTCHQRLVHLEIRLQNCSVAFIQHFGGWHYLRAKHSLSTVILGLPHGILAVVHRVWNSLLFERCRACHLILLFGLRALPVRFGIQGSALSWLSTFFSFRFLIHKSGDVLFN